MTTFVFIFILLVGRGRDGAVRTFSYGFPRKLLAGRTITRDVGKSALVWSVVSHKGHVWAPCSSLSMHPNYSGWSRINSHTRIATRMTHRFIWVSSLLTTLPRKTQSVWWNAVSRRLGPGGGTPLFGLYGDVPLDRVWFFGLAVLNRVYNLTCLCHKLVKNLS